MIQRMKQQAGIHSQVVSRVVDALGEAIQPDEEDTPIYTSGATNIFKYPELADTARASQLISALEDKKELVDMLKETSSGEEDETGTGIQVYIGKESPIENMSDCSVVTASYDLGDGMKGTIGIIGPKRMDYENVVDNLKTLKVQLDFNFQKKKTSRAHSGNSAALIQGRKGGESFDREREYKYGDRSGTGKRPESKIRGNCRGRDSESGSRGERRKRSGRRRVRKPLIPPPRRKSRKMPVMPEITKEKKFFGKEKRKKR